MKRTADDAERTRQALLEAAMAVFLRLGYSDTRIEDVAREAGLTRGAFYHHFPGKKEMYIALIQERYMPAMTLLDELFSDSAGDPVKQLFSLCSRYLSLIAGDRRFREVHELILLKSAFVPELEDSRSVKTESVRGILAWMESRLKAYAELTGKSYPDMEIRDRSYALLATLNGIISQWLIDPEGYPLMERSEHLARIVVSAALPHFSENA